MKLHTSILVFFAALPKKIYNTSLNYIASRFESCKIVIDWTDARILNPANLVLHGSFNAGRGLWLQAIGPNSRIEFGDGAMLSDWVHIGAVGTVRIGRHVLIGSKVVIIDHSHGQLGGDSEHQLLVPPAQRPLFSKGDIHIGNNVWLGDNVVVLSGVQIGDYCVVGANSVVSRDLPSGVIAVGSPAVPIKLWDSTLKRWVQIRQVPEGHGTSTA
jgi:lipopolysaccharide O-acetyltransferase